MKKPRQFIGTYACMACGRRVRVYDYIPAMLLCAKCAKEEHKRDERADREHREMHTTVIESEELKAMAEHIERMQELLDSIALMVGTPGDDPGDLDGFEVLRLHVRAAVDRGKHAEQVLEALAGEFERAVYHHENKGKGGQQVTATGDFVNVGPSVVGRMRWWLKRMKGENK